MLVSFHKCSRIFQRIAEETAEPFFCNHAAVGANKKEKVLSVCGVRFIQNNVF